MLLKAKLCCELRHNIFCNFIPQLFPFRGRNSSWGSNSSSLGYIINFFKHWLQAIPKTHSSPLTPGVPCKVISRSDDPTTQEAPAKSRICLTYQYIRNGRTRVNLEESGENCMMNSQ